MPQVSGTIAVKSAFLMLFRPCEGCICLIEFWSLAMIIIRAIPLLLNSTLHFSIFCGVKSCNRSPILDNEAPGLFVWISKHSFFSLHLFHNYNYKYLITFVSCLYRYFIIFVMCFYKYLGFSYILLIYITFF